jgi:curli production assembly/transport component CsgF
MAPASELVYTPINPSFGGNPLNGSWLLNQAQAQNRFSPERDLMEDFEERLTRNVLARLARMIIDEAFGEYGEGLEAGYYEVGNYTIDITTDLDFITIFMEDVVTGDTTTIKVPYYEF